MEPTTTTDAPKPEGTGANTGAGAGAGTSAGGDTPTSPTEMVFTDDQEAVIKARISKEVKERLAREQDTERKRQQREQQQATEQQATEQGKFKELAETRAKRITDLEAQLARQEREMLITRVAARNKLPEDLAARLQGSTEAELDADAKKLASMLQPPKAPATEAGAGSRPTASNVGANTPPTGPASPAPNNGKTQRYVFQQPGDRAWE